MFNIDESNILIARLPLAPVRLKLPLTISNVPLPRMVSADEMLVLLSVKSASHLMVTLSGMFTAMKAVVAVLVPIKVTTPHPASDTPFIMGCTLVS